MSPRMSRVATAIGFAVLTMVASGHAIGAPEPSKVRNTGMPREKLHEIEPLDLLDGVVVGDRVRYDVAASRRQALSEECRRLANVDTTGVPPQRRMAMQIDLYNLVMIVAVLEYWKPGWTPAADGFAVFRERRVPSRAGDISLDELEKRRTLAVFRDPRAHVAFNCAARSCPPLGARAWARQPDLDRALDDAMRAFVSDSTRNRIDDAHRTLRLSRIFDWYAADFGGRAGVLRTVSRYLGRDVTAYRVEYLDYDWSLNAATYPDGSRPR